jgi:hypothetical protein
MLFGERVSYRQLAVDALSGLQVVGEQGIAPGQWAGWTNGSIGMRGRQGRFASGMILGKSRTAGVGK